MSARNTVAVSLLACCSHSWLWLPPGILTQGSQGRHPVVPRMVELECAWRSLPEAVQSRLTTGGTGKHNGAALENLFEDEEDCRNLARQQGAGAKEAEEDQLVAALLALRDAARAIAVIKRHRLTPSIMIQHRGTVGVSGGYVAAVRLATARGALGGMVEDKVHQPRKWTTRRQKKVGQFDGDPAQRTKVEEEERARRSLELSLLLEEANSLRFGIPQLTMDPSASMRHCAGATRARTIRLRVRARKNFRFWLMCSTGRPWPGSVAEVLDYFDDLCTGGCARTVPESWLSALGFMEEKGSYPADKRFSLQPIVVSTVKSIAATLSAGAAPTRKAPALSIYVFIALEVYICDDTHPLFLRGFAWLKLIMVWGALRTNDLQGICPHHLRCTQSGLALLIDRSKASGPGKRMRWLPAYVAAGATITGPPWLLTGYELWQKESLAYPRDYLLPLPTDDLAGAIRKPAGYADSAALSRRLLDNLLYVQVSAEDNSPPFTEEPLLSSGAVDFFKEHGDRNVVNSLAACLEVEKSQRDFLGRWQPQQSDDYFRTHKAVAKKIQGQVIYAIRNDDVRIDETETISELKDYLKEKGWKDGPLKRQLDLLQPKTGLAKVVVKEDTDLEGGARRSRFFAGADRGGG